MDILHKVSHTKLKADLPNLEPGQTVRVHQKVKEGEKERIQIFEGILIARQGGKGMNGSFTVRKISEGIGVERIFPLQTPTIAKVEVVKKAKVRRAKLYYLRNYQKKLKDASA